MKIRTDTGFVVTLLDVGYNEVIVELLDRMQVLMPNVMLRALDAQGKTQDIAVGRLMMDVSIIRDLNAEKAAE